MRTLGWLCGFALLGVAGTASADEQSGTVAQEQTSPPVQTAPPGGEPGTRTDTSTATSPFGPVTPFTERRLILDQGKGALRVFAKFNMTTDFVAQPVTITPDLFFGITNYLQFGVVHTSPLDWQTPGFIPTALCITGKDNGCPKVYNNTGFDVLALLLPGRYEIAGHVRYDFSSWDPLLMNVLVGFESKLRLPYVSLLFNPAVQIGLNKRDIAGGPTPAGNKEIIYLPIEIVYQATPLLAIAAQSALWAPVKNFGDTFQIPLGGAALFTISPMVDVGLRFAWDNLGKVQTPYGARIARSDGRTLTAMANIYF